MPILDIYSPLMPSVVERSDLARRRLNRMASPAYGKIYFLLLVYPIFARGLCMFPRLPAFSFKGIVVIMTMISCEA